MLWIVSFATMHKKGKNYMIPKSQNKIAKAKQQASDKRIYLIHFNPILDAKT